MAVVDQGAVVAGASSPSGTSCGATAVAAASIGDLVVVFWGSSCSAGNARIPTITDSVGNTYHNIPCGQSLAGGTLCGMAYSFITTAIVSSVTTFTATWATTQSAMAFIGNRFTGATVAPSGGRSATGTGALSISALVRAGSPAVAATYGGSNIGATGWTANSQANLNDYRQIPVSSGTATLSIPGYTGAWYAVIAGTGSGGLAMLV